jgi:hypothetical protein
VAEGARLESVYTATYRGFESLSHRHLFNDIMPLFYPTQLSFNQRFSTCISHGHAFYHSNVDSLQSSYDDNHAVASTAIDNLHQLRDYSLED